ncbi:MAG: glycosyltransferase family 4 protein [Clostridia bacterium]|nr:glycosyltransferase family 4 protein [Clostridia bacterium]
MNRILFYDLLNDGHHWNYNFNLVKGFSDYDCCYYTSLSGSESGMAEQLDSASVKIHTVKLLTSKNKFIRLVLNLLNTLRLIRFAEKNRYDRLHILYFDQVIVHLLLKIFFGRSIKVSATLHWLPKQRIKLYILSFLLKYSVVDIVIVHGEYLRNRLIESLGDRFAHKIFSVHYPIMSKNTINNKEIQLDLPELQYYHRPFVLCFGGTRYDKGLDLLLSAVNLIQEKQFSLLIVGEEQYFKRQYIEGMVSSIRNKVFLKLQYIPENMMSMYFSAADIVVLPYRKFFSGQSGPLTEAANHRCIAIGPDVGQVGYTIQHYRLGEVFEAENVTNIAETLGKVIDNAEVIKSRILENQKKYCEICSLDGFVEAYRRILFS